MKIIDRKTGKRLDEEEKEHKSTLKDNDPIIRDVDKDAEIDENSPMDPPDAYDANEVEGVAYEDMHSLLQNYMDEHKVAVNKIKEFEKALAQFKELGYKLNDEINTSFSDFFQFFDNNLMDHNQREEKELFGLLHKRLIESGEKGEGDNPQTAVDMMEDDHIKFIQLGALAFNMLGLATRLQDERSRTFVNDVAYNNGRELAELLHLHIYREDKILFPLAHKLISTEEFDAMN